MRSRPPPRAPRPWGVLETLRLHLYFHFGSPPDARSWVSLRRLITALVPGRRVPPPLSGPKACPCCCSVICGLARFAQVPDFAAATPRGTFSWQGRDVDRRAPCGRAVDARRVHRAVFHCMSDSDSPPSSLAAQIRRTSVFCLPGPATRSSAESLDLFPRCMLSTKGQSGSPTHGEPPCLAFPAGTARLWAGAP